MILASIEIVDPTTAQEVANTYLVYKPQKASTQTNGMKIEEALIKAIGSKPCFIFTGSEWETLETYQKLKNLLLDLFRGTVVEGINVNGLDHVIVCTSFQNKVAFRCYSVTLTKAIDNRPRVDLNEMGPRFDIGFRRSKFASADLMRAATKKPKELAPKKLKNVSRDDLTGDKLGQIHLDRQDVYSMQTRRIKALRKTPGNLKKEKVAEPQDES